MKKTIKTVLIVLLALILIAAVVCAVLLINYNNTYIGAKRALEIALEDAGLEAREIIDQEAEFERTRYDAWYEVEFEKHGMEYDYSIDALTGDILHKSEKPDR